MEIILLTDIPKLGKKNSIVKVRPGFANNHLIPRGWAIVATRSNKKQHEEHLKHIAYRVAKAKKQAEHLAQKLQSLNITLQMQTGEHGKIFGNITPSKIKEQLQALDIQVESKQIKIPSPIQTVGKHPIILTLHEEVTANLELIVENASK